jgi:hypothetical protein
LTDVQLPLWVEYAKALGAPIVALVAAGIAGGIAYRQWRTARNKLKLDLFDKRIKVYEAAVELIKEISMPHPVTVNRVTELGKGLGAARWLFGSEVARYAHRLVERGYEASAKQGIEFEGLTKEQKIQLALSFAQNNWRQVDKELAELSDVFAPYLTIEH